jgi:hypothetical protein
VQIAPLTAEVERAWQELEAPAALLTAAGQTRPLTLADVEQLFDSHDLVLDACRRRLRSQQHQVELARRPVLFALARELSEAWPADASRDRLIASAFGARRINDSHRARLRVELGRLRRELRSIASIRATRDGFVLTPKRAQKVVVLAPPSPDHDTALLALLAGGERWSTSALALALGASQRTVQRALAALEMAGKVSSFGRGRLCRWLGSPVHGFATSLLLPAGLPVD